MDLEERLQDSYDAALVEIEDAEIGNVKANMQNLYNVWQTYGIDINQKSQRAKVVWVHVQNLLKDILEEEIGFLTDIKKNIEDYQNKIQLLSNALAITQRTVTDDCLIKKEEILRQELDRLSKLKHKRMKVYHDLKRIEIKYCQILNLPEQFPLGDGVPSEKTLSELKQRVGALKEKTDRRYKNFCIAQKELIKIWEATEMTPETPFEREILSRRENSSLSDDTLKMLEETISKARKKKSELQSHKVMLIGRLSEVWTSLKVDDDKMIEFLSKHTDCRLSTLKSIEQELERCEKIQKDNTKRLIMSLRQELQQLWNKCYVSESTRQCFKYYSCSETTNEVLEAHKTEVEMWENYFVRAQHILKMIDKREKQWESMIELDRKATDPNRLKSRKGSLLLEERKRKRLQRELHALESSIFQEIEVYESQTGRTLLYYGKDYRTFVTNQWTEKMGGKENVKRGKHKQQALQLRSVTETPKKPPPLSTPKSAPTKLLKSSAGTHMFITPSAQKAKVAPNTVGKFVTKASRLFGHRPNAIDKKDRKLALGDRTYLMAPQNKTLSTGMSYTDFAKELKTPTRYNLQSSILSTRKSCVTRLATRSKSKN